MRGHEVIPVLYWFVFENLGANKRISKSAVSFFFFFLLHDEKRTLLQVCVSC